MQITRLTGRVKKGWGSEEIWVSNDHYCSKFLHFDQGAQFSMHFHSEKIETWYVISGEFIVRTINTKDASQSQVVIKAGDVWHNEPLVPHQVTCLLEGTILEVSTPDSVEDNYRVLPGDSQRAK